ncbi:MAG: asparagine synthase-related protein [Gammaproteobacteria bacterium]
MSGFAMIVHRDGRPVEPALLAEMVGRMSHRAVDGCDASIRKNLGMAHLHFYATPEEVGEKQPLCSDDGRWKLVFDGRIDNRLELAEKLPEKTADLADISDARLMLLGFVEFGERFFEWVVGEFALAVHDTLTNRTTLARDPLGDRALYYRCRGDLLLAASEECAIAAHPEVSRELDERRIVSFLALSHLTDDRTFFREIKVLLPAHVMVVDARSVSVRRYWAFRPAGKKACRSDREYAERYRELFEESVRCRLRSPGRIGVLMSGGLDSTSVAAVAARMPESGGAPLLTVSWVFDEIDGDERRYMDAMAEKYPLQTERVVGDRCLTYDFDHWMHNPNGPELHPDYPLTNAAYSRAVQNGSRVLLTGMYGDNLFGNPHAWIRELIGHGRFIEAKAEMLLRKHKSGWLGAMKTAFLHETKFHIAATKLRKGKKAWLTDETAKFLDRKDSWPAPPRKVKRRGQFNSLMGLTFANNIAVSLCQGYRAGIELRNPYRDKRLIEFMLEVPSYLLYKKGFNRAIQRDAMQSFLPASVRTRKDKASLMSYMNHSLDIRKKPLTALLLSNLASVKRWLDVNWIVQILNEYHTNDSEGLAFWRAVCVEIYLRNIDQKL